MAKSDGRRDDTSRPGNEEYRSGYDRIFGGRERPRPIDVLLTCSGCGVERRVRGIDPASGARCECGSDEGTYRLVPAPRERSAR